MKTIRKGDKGPSVTELQNQLNAKGYHLLVDGDFGESTARAVIQFQLAQGLKPDGLVGDKTWAEVLVEARRTPPPKAMVEAQQELLATVQGLGLDQRRTDVLRTAIGDLGKAEANGSNEGPQIDHLVGGYRGYWKIDPTSKAGPWCAMACSSWVRIGLAIAPGNWKSTPMGQFFGGSSQWRTWAKANGRWSQTPEPGAVFVMGAQGSDSDADTTVNHSGMVLEVLPEGKVRTIEGNVSNRVVTMVRKVEDLSGFARWW